MSAKRRWLIVTAVAGLLSLLLVLVWVGRGYEYRTITQWLDEQPERREIVNVKPVRLQPREADAPVRVYGLQFGLPHPPTSIVERWEGFTVAKLDRATVVVESLSHEEFMKGIEEERPMGRTRPEGFRDTADWLVELYSTTELSRDEFQALSSANRSAYKDHLRMKASEARALRGIGIVQQPQQLAVLFRGYHLDTPDARLFVGDMPRSSVWFLSNSGEAAIISVIADSWTDAESTAELIAATVHLAGS